MLRPSIDGKRKDSGSIAARYDLSSRKSEVAMIMRTSLEKP